MDIVDTALSQFARYGYAHATLDAIAAAAGTTPAALTEHHGGKPGLYRQALERAADTVAPEGDALDLLGSVPVDGIRRFVTALFESYRTHPACVQLLLRENLDPVAEAEDSSLEQRSDIALHVERLLMLGQDTGAFRPGISAEDVLVLAVSLCQFHTTHAAAGFTVGRIDVDDPRNVEGLKRLVVDTVLAFLTSNIPHSGHDSYLVAEQETPSAQGIY